MENTLLPLIWNTDTIDDELSRRIALQTIADGRLCILMKQNFESFSSLISDFLQQFQNLGLFAKITYNEKETQIINIDTEDINIDESIFQVEILISGFIMCTISIILLSNDDISKVSYFYPLLCIGIPSPSQDKTLLSKFNTFFKMRTFPNTDISSFVKQRTQSERRNRELLHQFAKTRQELENRYKAAAESLEQAQEQINILKQKAYFLQQKGAPEAPKAFSDVEEYIHDIENSIENLVTRTMELAEQLETTPKTVDYTRQEELGILEELREKINKNRSRLKELEQSIASSIPQTSYPLSPSKIYQKQ